MSEPPAVFGNTFFPKYVLYFVPTTSVYCKRKTYTTD